MSAALYSRRKILHKDVNFEGLFNVIFKRISKQASVNFVDWNFFQATFSFIFRIE